jgi:hypothetical protein
LIVKNRNCITRAVSQEKESVGNSRMSFPGGKEDLRQTAIMGMKRRGWMQSSIGKNNRT